MKTSLKTSTRCGHALQILIEFQDFLPKYLVVHYNFNLVVRASKLFVTFLRYFLCVHLNNLPHFVSYFISYQKKILKKESHIVDTLSCLAPGSFGSSGVSSRTL